MITIEDISDYRKKYIVRIGDDNTKFGNDFDCMCVAVETEPGTIMVKGFVSRDDRELTLERALMFRRKFKELGYSKIKWARAINGEVKDV